MNALYTLTKIAANHGRLPNYCRLFGLSLILLMTSSAVSWAQLSLGTLEPATIDQGETLEVVLFGGGFGDAPSISFEGTAGMNSGLSIGGAPTVLLGADASDGRGDRLTFSVTAAPNAQTGRRNLIVTNSGTSESRTKFAAMTIRSADSNPGGTGGMGGNGGTGGSGNSGNTGGSTGGAGGTPGAPCNGLYSSLPPRRTGQINAITRASPPKGEVGGQVNLWIEGREFPSDVQVKFSTTKIENAYNSQSMQIFQEVYPNTQGTCEELDGILYFARIAVDAPLGPVSITLTSPSTGVTYTEEGLFEIVEEGQGLIFDETGAEDIEQVTGASPAIVRAGANTAMWLLGRGFNIDSTVSYSHQSLRQAQNPEVVIEAQNAPGFDGIRSYLQIPPTAQPGPVSVTVANPNGTTQTGVDLFEIYPPASLEGQDQLPNGGAGACEGDDFLQNVSAILGAEPSLLARGEETDLKIYANGLACRASFILYGGGIEVIGDQPVYPDQADPALRFFQLRVRVSPSAPLGPRRVAILNPNGSSKTEEGLITIVASRGGAGAACQSQSGAQPLFILIFTLISLMFLRLRITQETQS